MGLSWAMTCPTDDVNWGPEGGDNCWVCGQPGVILTDRAGNKTRSPGIGMSGYAHGPDYQAASSD